MAGSHSRAVLHRILFRSVARIRSRLHDLLCPRPRLVIKFPAEQELFMSLSEGNTALRQISAAFHRRGTGTAKDLLVRHFRKRTFPRFFRV